ncbi:bifunctional 5,10-methylenetetrahydrofolate dehydrogenase/5,10-methenyltetrahydrofolate cyclohydrolase [Acanthopleuribacter pedis]|uniref:Bifunctional protein FolD n=1 Tax=Acanthopleuribacter pedis TaxID=442870 RepID=A0A8J7U4J6_9BACT|nr:tetrahydrofolate dehydrogenase/cyclohydrolase catalytic domain-containing protein [Acanthopleuribacter pedis]MBO1319859.1 bifunctional methylenetetrahydrofolate dehydrogenase/methenyltetrahydrofolate cyclohydrolase [Acanthopleuribacter pedis]
MGKRWSCKATGENLLAQAKEKVTALNERGVEPHLAVVLVGEDPASKVYVSNKIRTCESLGIKSTFHKLEADTDTDSLLSVVDELNGDNAVHGILVQLPLPKQVDESRIIAAINPDKDVDGFHPVNVGRLSLGEPGLFPCTPMGVIALLRDSGHGLSGKHAVVIGRSNIVGKPMAQLLLKENCTVSIIHSRTQNPADLCRQADIVVAAVGRPGLVDAAWLKPGALVVDVGINEITDSEQARKLIPSESKKMKSFREKGRVLYGDVNYFSCLETAELVTPVPGGIGRLTIAHLMVNCVVAAELQNPST